MRFVYRYLTLQRCNRGEYSGIPMPFFIYWPLKWWRDVRIAYLTWRIKREYGS